MSGNVCKCLKMYGNVWKWLDMFENGRNLEMSGKIRECREMLGNFKNCFEMEILGTLLNRYCLLLFLELKTSHETTSENHKTIFNFM